MGICKPSLYAAFGNKEALFLQAMGRYASSIDAHRTTVLEREPTGRQAVEALLRAGAKPPQQPSGTEAVTWNRGTLTRAEGWAGSAVPAELNISKKTNVCPA